MERIVTKTIGVIATSSALYLLLTRPEGVKALFNSVGALSTNFTTALQGRGAATFVKA